MSVIASSPPRPRPGGGERGFGQGHCAHAVAGSGASALAGRGRAARAARAPFARGRVVWATCACQCRSRRAGSTVIHFHCRGLGFHPRAGPLSSNHNQYRLRQCEVGFEQAPALIGTNALPSEIDHEGLSLQFSFLLCVRP